MIFTNIQKLSSKQRHFVMQNWSWVGPSCKDSNYDATFPYLPNLKSNRETSMVSLTKKNLLIEIRKNNKPPEHFMGTDIIEEQ